MVDSVSEGRCWAGKFALFNSRGLASLQDALSVRLCPFVMIELKGVEMRFKVLPVCSCVCGTGFNAPAYPSATIT